MNVREKELARKKVLDKARERQPFNRQQVVRYTIVAYILLDNRIQTRQSMHEYAASRIAPRDSSCIEYIAHEIIIETNGLVY